VILGGLKGTAPVSVRPAPSTIGEAHPALSQIRATDPLFT
jgi:hypothetical protein